MAARAGENGVKASAILAASGGLVAAFALPAQAASSTASAAKRSVATAPTHAQAAVQAAPAVVAPETLVPEAPQAVGIVGVTAVEKPTPPPAPVVAAPRTAQQASRSGVRTAPAADAPVRPNVSGGVLGIAASYTGIYYRYGGTTPAGFDCSGFVQFVFGQAGKSLPRTATAQAQATQRVSNPQPGDLVFFGTPGYASHVGIYAGNGMMYDSPRTGKTTSLRAIYSSNVFYGRV